MTGRELEAAPLRTSKAVTKKPADDERARDPRDQVRAVVRAAGSSFTWGMRILPRPRREAMYAIYAFCRAVDD
ncbi:MAG: squalene/phytoene synthase family protein, partial [Kiloniellales bacterium]